MLPDTGMGTTETQTNLSTAEVAEVLDRLGGLIDYLRKSRELMDAKEAADFLRLPYTEFKRLAPTLPRHAVTERRYVYSRRELLEWYFSR
jgi:hypothetical protein